MWFLRRLFRLTTMDQSGINRGGDTDTKNDSQKIKFPIVHDVGGRGAGMRASIWANGAMSSSFYAKFLSRLHFLIFVTGMNL